MRTKLLSKLDREGYSNSEFPYNGKFQGVKYTRAGREPYYHYFIPAIDFIAPANTVVFAMDNGTVIKVGKSGLWIKHSIQKETYYAFYYHIDHKKKVGDYIKRGSIIGYIAKLGYNTKDGGTATVEHLHLETYSTPPYYYWVYNANSKNPYPSMKPFDIMKRWKAIKNKPYYNV